MKFAEHHPTDNDVIVKVMSSSGRLEDIVIRNTFEKVKLGGKDYFRYQIIKPQGYEKEEIIHRIGRSYEGLIISVFMTLAQARSPEQDKREL